MRENPHALSLSDHLARAKKFIAAGQSDKAEALLEETITAYPTADSAHHLLGLIAFTAGKLEQSIERVGTAAGLAAGNALYQRDLGELCRRAGRPQDAIQHGQKACQLAPQDAEAHFNLGLAFADAGLWPEAVAAYQTTLNLNPGHGTAWNNLGVAFERHARSTEAQQSFLRALQLNGRNVEALINLTSLFRREGRRDEACAYLQLAEKISPGLAAKMGLDPHDPVAPIHPPRISMRDTQTARGRGMFAECSFKIGEQVEASPVILLQGEYHLLPPLIKTYVFNWGALCGVGTAQALALGYGGLYNHDNPANLRYEADPKNLQLVFIARREIACHEELTINYNSPTGIADKPTSDWFTRLNISRIQA